MLGWPRLARCCKQPQVWLFYRQLPPCEWYKFSSGGGAPEDAGRRRALFGATAFEALSSAMRDDAVRHPVGIKAAAWIVTRWPEGPTRCIEMNEMA